MFKALTIAGSDSGGCAGIQADLKTFAALEVHGMTAITAITAQDTQRVHSISLISEEMIAAQIDAVTRDIGVDAVKTGMLATAAIVETVAAKLAESNCSNIVVDPVMVSTGGDTLIQQKAVEATQHSLFPLAAIVTPNLYEARVLTGLPLEKASEMYEAARKVLDLGPKSVVIKGGHWEDLDDSSDLFFDGHEFEILKSCRFPTRHTHGSGCSFAAAIAAYLARGNGIQEAVSNAKKYISEAIRCAFPLGHGNGPVCHFHAHWNRNRS